MSQKRSPVDRLLKEIQSEMESGRLALLCGAGLSSPSPSNLPLASNLVSEVQRIVLDSFEHFVGVTDLRPEVVFKLISSHAADLLHSVLQHLLGSVNFNRGHLFAAQCLAAQNPVVTTNFDQLIEAACEAEVIPFLRIPSHRLDSPTAPILFKIHGTVDVISSLMYTIDHVYKGPHKKAVSLFNSVLRDRTILVLGYSGLDQLDIMPLLAKAEVKKILWFSHDWSREDWAVSKPPSGLIETLPNLEHFSGNTDNLVVSFVTVVPLHSQKAPPKRYFKVLPKRIRGRIVVDVLMHQNQYAEALGFIRETGLGRYVEFRVSRLEALGGTGKRDGRYWRLRSNLWETLVSLPPERAFFFIAPLAKFAKTSEEREIAMSLFEHTHHIQGNTSPASIEASLELAYELGLEGDLVRAEVYLSWAIEAAELASEILLLARASIIKSAILIIGYNNAEPSYEIAVQVIDEAQRAMDLLDSQIVHDEYFYCQARNNRATGRRFIEKYEGAVEDYKENLNFFEAHSVNHTIHTLYNMSFAYLGMNEYHQARELLMKARNFNLSNARSFMLDKIEDALSNLKSLEREAS